MNSVHSSLYRRVLERLRAARRQAGLTQWDVARELGRPQSFVSKCESGERRIDVVELWEFACLYGKPLAYFIGESERGLSGGAALVAERPPRFGRGKRTGGRVRSAAARRRRS
jgi:transcriptional regulator with XRE-family HTH domain